MSHLRVAVDSNVLISAVRTGTSILGGLWAVPSIDLLVSQYVIGEVGKHLAQADQRARLWRLIYKSHVIPDGDEVVLPEWVSLPPKDSPILQGAIAGRADLLVTGDLRHFKPLFGTTIEGVLVESTAMFKSRYPGFFPARSVPE